MKKVFLFLFLTVTCALASRAYEPSESLIKKLQALKQQDQLATWIDERINYTIASPINRITFLMKSQQEIWRGLKSNQEKEAYLYLLINQGYYQLYAGDILNSILSYEKAYDFYNKYSIKVEAEEYILKPLANNYTRIGDYQKAIYIQNKSLQIALAKQNKELAASICSNLAISHQSKNDLLNAEKIVKQGIALQSEQNALSGLLLCTLAEIKFEQHFISEAQELANQAINLLRKNSSTNTPYWLLSAYSLAGSISLEKHQLAAAEKFYKQAIAISAIHFKHARKRELARIYTQVGKIHSQEKQFEKAISYFDYALELLVPNYKSSGIKNLPKSKELYAENKLQDALIEKAKALQQLAYPEAALQAYLLSFEVSEKIRSEYGYTISKQQLQAESKNLAEQAIEIAYQLWKKTGEDSYAYTVLALTEKTKARILADEISANDQKLASRNQNTLFKEKIKLENALAYYQKQNRLSVNKATQQQIETLYFKLSNIKKKLRSSLPTSTNTFILSKIPSGKRAIAFFYGELNDYIIVANSKGIKKLIQLPHAAAFHQRLENYLATYFHNGPAAMINNPKTFYKASNAIYKQLFSEIDFTDQEEILIIKDGLLNFLPFESLITSSSYEKNLQNWPYLLKKAAITYSYSIQSLSKEPVSKPNAPLLFNGIFISKTGSGKANIKAVELEYLELQKLLKGRFAKNKDVTVKRFKQTLQEADVLHISSHAYITDSLKDPVLELYKDKYYLFELGATQRVPQLLILSACQTADGELLSGEGVNSLSRGFIAAGAKGVVSSLWKVNDESAAGLMQIFYKEVVNHKKVAPALRNAKLSWLANTKNKMLLLPYYWDSLIYVGSPQDIVLEKAFWLNPIYVFISIVLIMLLILALWKYKLKNKDNTQLPTIKKVIKA